MRIPILGTLGLLLLATSAAYAQFNQPNPCRIIIEVTYDNGRDKVEFAEVELSDAMGTSTAMDRKDTNKDGRVEFQSYTGKHRVRIRGADIVTYDGDFEVMPGESFSVQRIRVKRSPGGATGSPVSGVASAARFAIPDQARKEYEKGRDLLTQRKWEDARERFEAVILAAPEFDLGHYYHGVAALQLKDEPTARASFEKAVTLNERFAEAQRTYVRLLLLPAREYPKVADLLAKSLLVEPDNTWALTYLAYAELQLQKFSDAQLHAQRVHGLEHQGMANAHMIAAYALDAQGKKKEAIREFKLYLKEDPKGPNVKRAQEFIARLEQE